MLCPEGGAVDFFKSGAPWRDGIDAGQRVGRPAVEGPPDRGDRHRQHLGGLPPPPRRGRRPPDRGRQGRPGPRHRPRLAPAASTSSRSPPPSSTIWLSSVPLTGLVVASPGFRDRRRPDRCHRADSRASATSSHRCSAAPSSASSAASSLPTRVSTSTSAPAASSSPTKRSRRRSRTAISFSVSRNWRPSVDGDGPVGAFVGLAVAFFAAGAPGAAARARAAPPPRRRSRRERDGRGGVRRSRARR